MTFPMISVHWPTWPTCWPRLATRRTATGAALANLANLANLFPSRAHAGAYARARVRAHTEFRLATLARLATARTGAGLQVANL